MSLPEELIERIVEHALAVPSPRPPWARSSLTRLAPLVVSSQFNRIATPLLYRSIHLTTPRSAALLLESLLACPEHARHIRELVVDSVWRPVIDILRVSQGLTSLDLTLGDEPQGVDLDPVLTMLADMRHLALRKASNVYLSLAGPRAVIISLAHAIPAWPDLRTVDIAFKLSDDTPTSPAVFLNPYFPTSLSPPVPAQPPNGPITCLAAALAAAPALHTFSTHLPSVWNTSIATIASNPSLARICLSSPSPSVPPAIPGTGLFLTEARRHPRLAELINAGTPIIRSRAHTLGTRLPPSPSPFPSPSPSPSPPPAASPMSSPARPPAAATAVGLRIDTSDDAIAGLASTCASPAASTAAESPRSAKINPAWIGPVRGASVKVKGKGKRWTRG